MGIALMPGHWRVGWVRLNGVWDHVCTSRLSDAGANERACWEWLEANREHWERGFGVVTLLVLPFAVHPDQREMSEGS